MNAIKSQLTNKNLAGSGMRTFEVPDEDYDNRTIEDIESEIKLAKQERLKPRLNEGAKKRIEVLVGMTRNTRTVTIDKQEYSFQTLRGKEMREALFNIAKFDGTIEGPFETRKQLLARSLTHVAKIPVEEFIGSESLEAKMDFIEELDQHLLNRLYDEYLLLIKETRDRYAIKNEEDLNEVVADLKK